MPVTGKVQKFKMRETAVDELGLGEAAVIATGSSCGSLFCANRRHYI